MHVLNIRRVAVWSGAALVASAGGVASGQAFSADFEAPTYSGSVAGVALTAGFGGGGQQGWYNPVSGSADGVVHEYAGNPLGFAVNPSGGSQFVVGTHAGNAAFARMQHTIDFSAGGVWEAEFDCTGLYNGTLPAGDNLGSFSLQPSTTGRYFQQLMSYGPTLLATHPTITDYTASADHFHIAFGFHTAAAPTVVRFECPGAAWQDLPANNWYRCRAKWDFDTAQILEVSIQNLTLGGVATTLDVSGLGWYLLGGPGSTNALPTDIRLFTGGGAGTSLPGNVTAWDNISIAPAGGTACYANCDSSTLAPILNVADFTCFLTRFAAGDSYANCDNSTQAPVLNVADFTCFLQAFAAGCP